MKAVSYMGHRKQLGLDNLMREVMIKEIHDFDINKTVIAFCVDHEKLDVNGIIFDCSDYGSTANALNAAKNFLAGMSC